MTGGVATGGAAAGGAPSGGASNGGASGGGAATGGMNSGGTSSGGAAAGGSASGGSASGGSASGGSASGGSASGGSPEVSSGGETAAGGAASGGQGPGDGSGGAFTGTCTASQATNANLSGSGPHDVVVETNADPGINEGTIFRPAELGGEERYPIFVWGQGGCSRDGMSAASAMAEMASHGYFVVADGTPSGGEGRGQGGGTVAMGEPLLAYIDWIIAENDKPCSAYYESIETTKVATNGFSCGGLMATGTAGDPRITTWGHTSSGLFGPDDALYESIHTPVLIVTGTADSLGADDNGRRDYQDISTSQDVPIMFFAKEGADHGGDLFSSNGGDFTKIILAWSNWWLKDDQGATGKGMLVGPDCPYCSDASWEIQSAHLP